MGRRSYLRAETHADQAVCRRRPRWPPCHSLPARLTSAESPAGWSRGTLVLALRMRMGRRSYLRAETHADQALCLRRPRKPPCHRLRARSTSAKDPAGWSRVALALALETKMWKESCSRAKTHADRALCRRRPRRPPCHRLRARSTSAKDPVRCSRVTLALALRVMKRRWWKIRPRAETHADQALYLSRPRWPPCHRLPARLTSAESPAGWSRGTRALAWPYARRKGKGREREGRGRDERRGPLWTQHSTCCESNRPGFWFSASTGPRREGEEEKLAERRERCQHRDGVQVKPTLSSSFCSPVAMARARHPRSRAKTHADRALCRRRPRKPPCHRLRARSTSAKDPVGWSRVALALASD